MTELEVVNPLHKLYAVLSTIANKIKDVNYRRANSETIKERTWWYPTFPEENDENYPRGAITFTGAKVAEYGDAQYVGEVLDSQDNVIKEQFGQVLSTSVSMGIYVKKDQRHTGTYYDGTDHEMQNQKLADYMVHLLHNVLRQNRNLLIEAGFDFASNPTITPAYDDNHFLFAADETFDVIFLDVWNTEYEQSGIIQNIVQGTTVELVN